MMTALPSGARHNPFAGAQRPSANLPSRLPNRIEGIQVWAVSYCRSTLGFYEALARALNLPLRVCLARGGSGERGELGFSETEFAHLDLVETADEITAALALAERPTWLQLFGTYQTAAHIQATLAAALSQGMDVGVASEAPCNMESPGPRRLAQAAYLKYALPLRVARVTRGARFILNWSGDDAASLTALGWSAQRIIPMGYFPPPLPGTTFRPRSSADRAPFRILCSSALTWHRGPDLLVEALALLKRWGVSFEADFTGTGPLEAGMRSRVAEADLPVRFLGRVPMDELVALYEGCSVFVAPGRQEPWGIRVNDALNAGAPSIVSCGMGAVKLIDDLDAGLSFRRGDVTDLAWKLRRLATDEALYLRLCNALTASRDSLLPRVAAEYAAVHISAALATTSPADPK